MRLGVLIASLLLALTAVDTVSAATPQCDAGNQLLKADLIEDAQERFNQALDVGEGECAVKGLKAVAAATKAAAAAKQDDDDHLTVAEAWGQVVDFVTQSAPWIVLVLSFWSLLLVVAFLRGGGGVRVRAPASSKDLATRVAAVARAAGGDSAPPAKILTASDDVQSTTAADVAKVFRIPGTVPIGELLTQPPFSAWLSTRLAVTGSIGGGWGVIDLVLRNPFKTEERIAVDLADVDDDAKAEVLALIGGAWLNVALAGAGAPVRGGESDGLVDHALFRAGANQQSVGENEIARACYAAMRGAPPAVAPFAWVGSRLNQMAALKGERRWTEASQLANEIGDFPDGRLDEDEQRRFDRSQMDELRLRQRYITALLRIDHWYVLRTPELEAKADAAVRRLQRSLDEPAVPAGPLASLRSAASMAVLAYQLAKAPAGELPVDLGMVRAELGAGTEDTVGRQRVSPATYYDAACVVSLLFERHAPGAARVLHAREARDLLQAAVANTLEARRARLRAMANADPMFKALKAEDPTAFSTALGEPPAAESPSLPDAIATIIAELID